MSWRPLRHALALTAAFATTAAAQRLTSPRDFFGHEIGADYVLPDYTKFAEYWQRLARESDRMDLDTIGMTAEGRPQLMAIVSSPENLRNRERYRRIAERLARAEGLSAAEARQLAKEGKGIVWIDGGLHATEVLGAQQLIESNWQLVSGNDEETTRFRNDIIILMVHANPDGMELVSDWYMRNPDPQQRSTGGVPRLYQKYIGHDNNRDFYLAAMPESENMNRVLYTEWYPQVMYNHHQTGPTGTVMFAPPFRDPMNFNIHPLIKTGLDVVGGAMHNRFVLEEKGGVVMRSGAGYSTWWNGGLRTTVYFHNMIGLLTETVGNPSGYEIPFVASRQQPSADLPLPVKPGPWKFRSSVEYSVTANKAVLDVVSRNREHFLFNIWKMGNDRIESGSKDSWTIWPKRVASAQEMIEAENRARRVEAGQNPVLSGGGFQGAGQTRSGEGAAKMMAVLNDPKLRDPRAYVIPADQRDFPTAVKLIVALQKAGIDVHRANGNFSVGGKTYPAGSYVVKVGQAFGAHVLDMFEPQDHPNDFRVPGGPPTPPYDNAGWTLAMQMGVAYDRVFENVTGPLVKVPPATRVTPPAGTVASAPVLALSPRTNDAFIVVNRLLKAGAQVARKVDGTWIIRSDATSKPVVDRAARELGLSFTAGEDAGSTPVKSMRVGLWDRYGGSMPSGWTRWLLEQYEFPFNVVYPQELDAGNLKAKYDALIFVDGAIPAFREPGQGGQGGGGGGGFGGGAPNNASLPEEWRDKTGNVTQDRTMPKLREFVEAGGILISIGSSTNIAGHLGLPVSDHLVERTPDGRDRPLGSEKFYVPGSLLEVAVDNTQPATLGMTERAIVMFDNSPTFRLAPDAQARGVRPLMWFDTATPLRSGWAWGQNFLEGGVAAADARVGRGVVRLIGPEALFRAQPHGTFMLVFNGLIGANAPTM
jgi:hypothetical protein